MDVRILNAVTCLCIFSGAVYFLFTSRLWLYCLLAAFTIFIWKWTRKKRIGCEIVQGRAIVITGCDTGFGHDLATLLDSMGCTVFAGCLHADGEGASKLVQKCSKRLHVVAMDVGSDDSVNLAWKYIESHCPPSGLWAIVNNAGFNVLGDVELLGVDLYQKAMNVNFYGAIRVTRAFLYLVRRQSGRVINMSSGRGRFSFPRDSVYHVTKHCLETWNDSLRLEMARFGVRVSILEPGNYGGVTACHDAVQMARYREEIEHMWNNATDEMRRTYGRYYFDSLAGSTANSLKNTSASTTKPVMDAILDAMFSQRPEVRSLVPGGNGWYDQSPMFVRFYPFLPTWLSDRILMRWTQCHVFPKPTG